MDINISDRVKIIGSDRGNERHIGKTGIVFKISKYPYNNNNFISVRLDDGNFVSMYSNRFKKLNYLEPKCKCLTAEDAKNILEAQGYTVTPPHKGKFVIYTDGIKSGNKPKQFTVPIETWNARADHSKTGMSDGYEYKWLEAFVAVVRGESTIVYGPFLFENDAIEWAKNNLSPHSSWVIRKIVHSPSIPY